MASNTATRPGTDRRPLLSYLRVQRDREREMLTVLNKSVIQIQAELRRLSTRTGVGAAIRAEQLASTQAALHREIATLYRRLGLVIEAGRAEAAAAAVEGMYPMDLMRRVLPVSDLDYLLRSAKASASATVDVVEARLSGLSNIKLSDRVYHSRDLVDGRIDDIINNALSRGASAAELARDVRTLVQPGVRGGVRYAALRLGRTELNNAFHATQIQTAVDAPWTTGVKWNLSGSHPRPDACNDYADKTHYSGGAAGVFRPEETPGKPHPNCLCFCTSVTVGRDEFIDTFMQGGYDNYVDDIIANGGITIR